MFSFDLIVFRSLSQSGPIQVIESVDKGGKRCLSLHKYSNTCNSIFTFLRCPMCFYYVYILVSGLCVLRCRVYTRTLKLYRGFILSSPPAFAKCCRYCMSRIITIDFFVTVDIVNSGNVDGVTRVTIGK